MKSAATFEVDTGTRKPLVTGSIPVAATKPLKSTVSGQGIHQNHLVHLSTASEQGIFVVEAQFRLYSFLPFDLVSTI